MAEEVSRAKKRKEEEQEQIELLQGAEKLFQEKERKKKEQAQNAKFDADYFEQKYKRELLERQRKQN